MKRFAVLAAAAALIILQRPAISQNSQPYTVTGLEGAPTKMLMMEDGTMMPTTRLYRISIDLNDPYSSQAPADVPQNKPTLRLQNGYLPIPSYSAEKKDLSAVMRLFVKRYASGDVAFAQIRLTSKAPEARLFRIYATITPDPSKAAKTSYDKNLGALTINGKLAIVPQTYPQSAAGIKDSSHAVKMLFAINLKPGEAKSLVLAMPMALKVSSAEQVKSLRGLDANAALAQTVTMWEKRLNGTKLALPDPRYAEAFKASLGYILLNMNGNRLMPSPTANEFRYRDATYMVHALDVAGLTDASAKALQAFLDYQQPNGYFPATIGADKKPVGQKCWDAQGQALFALGRHYRFTQDKKWLESVFPKMVKGGDFLLDLIKKADTVQVERTPEDGLLPAGYSDKNMGDGSWHRYWDDCWAIGGLYEAMWSAYYLDREDLRSRFGQAGNDLNQATSQSYLRVRVKHNLYWVPNATEEIYTNAAVQSATPGIWPCRAFFFMDPMVNQSFITYYWKKWVEPNNGAFYYEDKYLPHVALGLAHSYLYFDHGEMTQPIVERALNLQTANGVYAWAEAASKADNKPVGDMPSGWAAAEFVNVVRDMLFREEREGINLFYGVPANWIEDGKTISLTGMPTFWGKFGLTFTPHIQDHYATLKFTGACQPTRGYMMRWPLSAKYPVRGVSVDGKSITRFSDDTIGLPPEAREVRIEF